MEAENSELVLETEAQRQQYEKCLDEIANQVVQALLAQKTLREECLKLQGRVRDLELQNQHLSMLFQQRFHGSSDTLLQLFPTRSGEGREAVSQQTILSPPSSNPCLPMEEGILFPMQNGQHHSAVDHHTESIVASKINNAVLAAVAAASKSPSNSTTSSLCVETDFPDTDVSPRSHTRIPTPPRHRLRSYSPPQCPTTTPMQPPRKCRTLGHRSGARQLPKLPQESEVLSETPQEVPGHQSAGVTGGSKMGRVPDTEAGTVGLGASPVVGRRTPTHSRPLTKPARTKQRATQASPEPSRGSSRTPPPLPPRNAVVSPPTLGLTRTNSSPASPACRSQYYYDYSDEDSDARPVSRDMSTASSLSLNELLDSSFEGDHVPNASLDDEFFSDWSTMCLSPHHRVSQPGNADAMTSHTPPEAVGNGSEPSGLQPERGSLREGDDLRTQASNSPYVRLVMPKEGLVQSLGLCMPDAQGVDPRLQRNTCSQMGEGPSKVKGDRKIPARASDQGSGEKDLRMSESGYVTSASLLVQQGHVQSTKTADFPDSNVSGVHSSSRVADDSGSKKNSRQASAVSQTSGSSVPCESSARNDYVTLQYQPINQTPNPQTASSASVQPKQSSRGPSGGPPDDRKLPSRSSSSLPSANQHSSSSTSSLPNEHSALSKSASFQPQVTSGSTAGSPPSRTSSEPGSSRRSASLSSAQSSPSPQTQKKRSVSSSSSSTSSIPKPTSPPVLPPKTKLGTSVSSPLMSRTRLGSSPASSPKVSAKVSGTAGKGSMGSVASYQKPPSPFSPPGSPLKSRGAAASKIPMNSPKLPPRTRHGELEQQKNSSRKAAGSEMRESSPSTNSLDKIGGSPSRLPKMGKGKGSKFDSWPGRIRGEMPGLKQVDTISGYSYSHPVTQNTSNDQSQNDSEATGAQCRSPESEEKSSPDLSPLGEKSDHPKLTSPYSQVMVLSNAHNQSSQGTSVRSVPPQRSRPENLILVPREKTFSYAGFSSASSSSAEEPKKFPGETTPNKGDNSASIASPPPTSGGGSPKEQQSGGGKPTGIPKPGSPKKVPPPVPSKPNKPQRGSGKGELMSPPQTEVQITVNMCTRTEQFSKLPHEPLSPFFKGSGLGPSLSKAGLMGELGTKLEHDLTKAAFRKDQLLTKHPDLADTGRKPGKAGNISRYFSGYEGGLCLRTSSDLAGRVGRQVVSPVGRCHSTDSSLENLRAGDQGERVERSGSRDDGYSTMSSDVLPESLERYADPSGDGPAAGGHPGKVDVCEDNVDSALETSTHSAELRMSSQSLSSQASTSSSPDFTSTVATPTTVISPTSMSKVRQMRQFFEEECQKSGTVANVPTHQNPCHSSADGKSLGEDESKTQEVPTGSSVSSCSGLHSAELSQSILSESSSCTDPFSPVLSPSTPSHHSLQESKSAPQETLTQHGLNSISSTSGHDQGSGKMVSSDGSKSITCKLKDFVQRSACSLGHFPENGAPQGGAVSVEMDSSSDLSDSLPFLVTSGGSEQDDEEEEGSCSDHSIALLHISEDKLLADIPEEDSIDEWEATCAQPVSHSSHVKSAAQVKPGPPLSVSHGQSAGWKSSVTKSSAKKPASLIRKKSGSDSALTLHKHESEEDVYSHMEDGHLNSGSVLERSASFSGLKSSQAATSQGRDFFQCRERLKLDEAELVKKAEAISGSCLSSKSKTVEAPKGSCDSSEEEEGHVDFVARWQQQQEAQQRPQELPLWQPQKTVEALLKGATPSPVQVGKAKASLPEDWLLQFDPKEIDEHLQGSKARTSSSTVPHLLLPAEDSSKNEDKTGSTDGRSSADCSPRSPRAEQKNFRSEFYSLCSVDSSHNTPSAREGVSIGSGGKNAVASEEKPSGVPDSRSDPKPVPEAQTLSTSSAVSKLESVTGSQDVSVKPQQNVSSDASHEGFRSRSSNSAKHHTPVSSSSQNPSSATPKFSSTTDSTHPGPKDGGEEEEVVEQEELEEITFQIASLSQRVSDLQRSLSSLNSGDSGSQLDLCEPLTPPGGAYNPEAGGDDYHWEDDALDLSAYGGEAESGRCDIFEGEVDFPDWSHETNILDEEGQGCGGGEKPATDLSPSSPCQLSGHDQVPQGDFHHSQLSHPFPDWFSKHGETPREQDQGHYHQASLSSSTRHKSSSSQAKEAQRGALRLRAVCREAEELGATPVKMGGGRSVSETRLDNQDLEDPEVRAGLLDAMVASCGESNDSLASDIGLDRMMCQRLMGPARGRHDAVRAPGGPSSRPALDFSKFFIRYSQPEREAVAAFDFLDNISTASESDHRVPAEASTKDGAPPRPPGDQGPRGSRRQGACSRVPSNSQNLEQPPEADPLRMGSQGGGVQPKEKLEVPTSAVASMSCADAKASPKARRLERTRQRRKTKQKRRQQDGKDGSGSHSSSSRLPLSTWSGASRGRLPQSGRPHWTNDSTSSEDDLSTL